MLLSSPRLAVAVVLCVSVGLLSVGSGRVAASDLIGPGQDGYDRETGTIAVFGHALNYELFGPPGCAAEAALPLVVYLHGCGDGRAGKQARLNDTMHDLVYATQRDNADRGVPPGDAAQYDNAYASDPLVPKIPVAGSWSPRWKPPPPVR